MIGTTLAHYRITAAIGAGGMGEVYRATDTRLDRDVALKLLPEGFAADPERHARFARDARVLASLNHPNIATLYGLEHLDEQHLLVMELVEGEGLGERIARGSMPVDEALRIALQIARALEAAHSAASSTATSSPPTSSSVPTARSRCWTSVWRRSAMSIGPVWG